jgi:predicted RNA-binding protein YlxR (DUF448 family)
MEQGVEVDLTGKKSGRGTYLHPYQICWRAALDGSRLEQALRTRLSAENRQALLNFGSSLPESELAEEEDQPRHLVQVDVDLP